MYSTWVNVVRCFPPLTLVYRQRVLIIKSNKIKTNQCIKTNNKNLVLSFVYVNKKFPGSCYWKFYFGPGNSDTWKLCICKYAGDTVSACICMQTSRHKTDSHLVRLTERSSWQHWPLQQGHISTYSCLFCCIVPVAHTLINPSLGLSTRALHICTCRCVSVIELK